MNLQEARVLADKAARYASACVATGNSQSVMCEVAAAVPGMVTEVEQLTERLTKSADAVVEMAALANRYDSQRLHAQQERDKAREQLAEAERELERWRHSITIEGDFVCPNELAAMNKEQDTVEAIAALLDRKAVHYAQNQHLGPYSVELAAEVRARPWKTSP